MKIEITQENAELLAVRIQERLAELRSYKTRREDDKKDFEMRVKNEQRRLDATNEMLAEINNEIAQCESILKTLQPETKRR